MVMPNRVQAKAKAISISVTIQVDSRDTMFIKLLTIIVILDKKAVINHLLNSEYKKSQTLSIKNRAKQTHRIKPTASA